MKYLTDTYTIATFKENIIYLTKRGFKPVFKIIDNLASKEVKKYLEYENIKMQLLEPHNHCVNAAECAIHNYNNHTIAGLITCDENFPVILWCRLIKKEKDTLNMLRTSHTHPKLSAYHILEGPHDFN